MGNVHVLPRGAGKARQHDEPGDLGDGGQVEAAPHGRESECQQRGDADRKTSERNEQFLHFSVSMMKSFHTHSPAAACSTARSR